MKHNFVRMKTRAKSVSLRTLALVMGVVMLLSAIGVGSTLSAYAVSADESTQSGALSAAAVVGSDIADRVALFNDSLVAEANAALRGDKADLANVGAKAELARTGASIAHYMIYNNSNNDKIYNWTDNALMKYDGSTYYWSSFSVSAGTNFYAAISTSTDYKDSVLSTQPSVSTSGNINSSEGKNYNYDNTTYYFARGSSSSTGTVYVRWDGGNNILLTTNKPDGYDSMSDSGSGGGSGGSGTSDTWTIAGNSTSIFGTEWDTSNTSNDMTMSGTNTYVKSYTVTSTDNFKFKIVKNHAWTTAYPSNDFEVTRVTTTSTRSIAATTENTGNLYWKSGDTITFTFNSSDNKISITSVTPENTHDVTFSASTGGTIIPSGTVSVGESTATAVTATANPGYKFSSWTNGTGITQVSNSSSGDNQNQSITTKATGTYTVKANFAAKNYTVSYGSATNGTFTVKKTADSSAVATEASLPYNTGITVECTPDKGYKLSSVKVNNSTSGVSGSGNTRTFNVPAANATITVTFALDDLAISTGTSPAGKGTVVASKTSGGSSTSTYQLGNTLYLKVTSPDGAYTVGGYTVTYNDGYVQTIEGATGNTGAIDVTHYGNTGAISIVANMVKKPTHSVTVVSNNKVLGKATSSVTNAYSGQSVTINAIEETATFNKWEVTQGTVSAVHNKTNKSITFNMVDEDIVIKAVFNNAYSGTSEWYYNGYTTSGKMSSAVTDGYSKPMSEAMIDGKKYSYYHVTARSGWDQLFTASYKSPDHSQGDHDYIYFHGGKGDNDYENNWGKDHNITCWFEASDGKLIKTGATMEYADWSDGYKMWRTKVPAGAKKISFKDEYKTCTWEHVDLTEGYRDQSCYWTNSSGSNGKYTVKDGSGNKYYNPVPNDFHEYFNGDEYVATTSHSFNTTNVTIGGGSHTIARPSTDANNYYILVLYPGNTYKINGQDVTVDEGTTPKIVWTSSLPQPEIEPDGTTRVTLYAKNGTLRDSTFNRFTNLADTQFEDYFSYSERTDSGVITYNSYAAYNAAHPDAPKISIEHNVSFGNSSYDIMYNVPVGAKVKVTTELSPNGETFRGTEKFSDTHYLKAYSFNGMTYKVFTKNDGVATTNGKKFTEEWTVRAVNTVRTNDDGTTTALTRTLTGTGDASVRIVEITPIYYMQDNTNCKTFYIDGYDGTVQQAWGNMLAVYPYYEGKSNSENAFGGYPGQPMLFWGGKYQMEIPLTVDGTANGATVKGLTLHNGYWDLLHRSVDLICNEHAQTYDFDDFYKIYKEKNPDSIIFDFKYRTTEDNYNDGNRDDYGYYKFAGTAAKGASDFDGDSHNGVELLTDYYGRPVDVFGKVLSESQRSTWSDTGTINHTQTKELLLVSNGYKHTYTGWYATMYAVYAPASASNIPSGSGDTAKKLIGYITPSMLYLNNIGRVAQYGADTTGGLDMTSTDPNMQNTYNHLKKYYNGVPAVIAYEKEILNDSRDQAKRSDGKWYYSNNTDQITANITIQYIDNETDVESVLNSANHGLTSDKWTNEETYTAGLNDNLNVGSHSKCTAYFTNTNPYLLGKVNSGLQFADSTKFFTFKAQAAGKYMFVGWVRERNGQYYSISDEEIGTSSMSANDHYIARFVKTTSGALTVSHNVEQTSQYTGKGTPYLTVTVLNGSDEEVFSQTVNDGSKIDVTDYITTKYNDFKINISLSTAPDVASESMMQEYVAPVVSGIGSIASTTPAPVAGSTATTTATVAEFTVSQLLALTGDNEISSLNYISHLSVPSYSYKYEIKYNYTSRFWGEQSYTATGTILSTDIEGMQNVTGSKLSAGLTDEFIEMKTPFEKNLNQTITWKYGEKTKETTKDSTWTQENQVFLIKYEVGTDQVVNDRVSAEFKLPYPYDPATYEPIKVDAYNGTGNDATPTGNSDYVYDDRNDTVKLSTKAYHLFTTNGTEVQGGDNVHANGLPLLQAAPYIIKGAEARIANKLTLQYFTGTSYTVDGQTGLYFVAKNESGEDTCYWYNVEPGAAYTGSANRVQLKESDVVYADTITGIPAHTYAVKGKFNNQDVVYYFDPDTAEKGQYNMHYFTDQIEGYKDGTGTKYYFTRWDIRNSKGDYIASSYLSTFNYSGYEDYSVEAIYDSLTPNPETDAAVAKVPTISYIGDSRNQWNTVNNVDGSGNVRTVLNKDLPNGDVLFHDFAISYDYYGEEIAKINSSDKVIRIGMLIEQVGALESVDGSKITDASYYADKYKDDYDAAALKNALESNRNPRSETGHNTVNSKIGNNVNNNWGQKFGTGGAYNPFGFSDVIDNMNRLQWYYTFDNNKDGENNFKNANYVYRASAYIIEGTGNGATATLSSTPVYFTLYDSARR